MSCEVSRAHAEVAHVIPYIDMPTPGTCTKVSNVYKSTYAAVANTEFYKLLTMQRQMLIILLLFL